eukprot:1837929-Heterocapsa_arctica.AAC.1
MAPTLDPQHWGLHGGNGDGGCVNDHELPPKRWCYGRNPMVQRNYACDSLIADYFGSGREDFNATGE